MLLAPASWIKYHPLGAGRVQEEKWQAPQAWGWVNPSVVRALAQGGSSHVSASLMLVTSRAGLCRVQLVALEGSWLGGTAPKSRAPYRCGGVRESISSHRGRWGRDDRLADWMRCLECGDQNSGQEDVPGVSGGSLEDGWRHVSNSNSAC